MKKIIRQILDDLKNDLKRPAQDHRLADSSTPKQFQPSTEDFATREHKPENHDEIKLTQAKAKPADLGDTDFDPDPQALLPEDLNNQTLSDDPEELTRQLDFQAQRSKERQTIG